MHIAGDFLLMIMPAAPAPNVAFNMTR
jgi:hypothetical protein